MVTLRQATPAARRRWPHAIRVCSPARSPRRSGGPGSARVSRALAGVSPDSVRVKGKPPINGHFAASDASGETPLVTRGTRMLPTDTALQPTKLCGPGHKVLSPYTEGISEALTARPALRRGTQASAADFTGERQCAATLCGSGSARVSRALADVSLDSVRAASPYPSLAICCRRSQRRDACLPCRHRQAAGHTRDAYAPQRVRPRRSGGSGSARVSRALAGVSPPVSEWRARTDQWSLCGKRRQRRDAAGHTRDAYAPHASSPLRFADRGARASRVPWPASRRTVSA